MVSIPRRAWCALLLVCVMPAAALAQDLPRPERGTPFASAGYTPPYEAVLDHCDVVLVGSVTAIRPAVGRSVDGTAPAIPGRIELAVEKVLRGQCAEKAVTIDFGGEGPWGLRDGSETRAFLCLRTKDGGLILAGDPPEGGGFVREGPAFVEKLLEAARDPEKGYQSADFAVKLSSAYRLAMAWVAAPADRKATPPPGLIATLIEGLRPDDGRRGPNVSAGPRDALNLLLDCNITMMWQWSVYHGSGRRENHAWRVKDAWDRTVAAVGERRKAGPNAKPDPFTRLQRARAEALLKKLASKEENDRLDAGRELTGMGDIGLAALAAGMTSDDADLAARSAQLRRQVFLNNAQADPWGATFDPLRAEPFVPAARPPTSSPAAP